MAARVRALGTRKPQACRSFAPVERTIPDLNKLPDLGLAWQPLIGNKGL